MDKEVKLQKSSPSGDEKRDIILAIVRQHPEGISAYDISKEIKEQKLFGKRQKWVYQYVCKYLKKLTEAKEIVLVKVVLGEGRIPKNLYAIKV